MEVNELPCDRLDNHQDQLPNTNENISELIQQLGNTGIDKALTGVLQQNILAQVVVTQLLDKIDRLQGEAECAKHTTITLASCIAANPQKWPAFPLSQSPDNEDHWPRQLHGQD